MGKVTPIGRLVIIVFIMGLLYGGYVLLKNGGYLKSKTAVSESGSGSSNGSGPSGSQSDQTIAQDNNNSSSENQDASASSNSGFDYTAPVPVDGRLKGVIELGASGFNSFVVEIDKDKNWKLQKAEFGYSLAIENMADKNDVRQGLKAYIGKMLEQGVSPKDIHFVVSSGAQKADNMKIIIDVLKTMKYYVNAVTAEQEGILALKAVLPDSYANKAFVVDIGSGNTKISWKNGDKLTSLESYGAKYFQDNTSDETVATEVKAKSSQIPEQFRQTCFIIGGVPFELAKQTRKDKERYTVLNSADSYKGDKAKTKAGLNIYNSFAQETKCKQVIFDWDANFTIGFLLTLPY